MKKSMLILAFLGLLFALKSNAQAWQSTSLTYPTGCPVIFGTAGGYPCDIPFYANGAQYMDLQWNTGYFAIGNGFVNPVFQLDILGTAGNLFRTTGNGSFDCDWEAWTGSGTGGSALVGRVYVPASTSNFVMEASHGALQFNTDSAKRMTITRKGNVVVYTSVILKASDGDNYYKLTVNNNGELKITQVNNQTL